MAALTSCLLIAYRAGVGGIRTSNLTPPTRFFPESVDEAPATSGSLPRCLSLSGGTISPGRSRGFLTPRWEEVELIGNMTSASEAAPVGTGVGSGEAEVVPHVLREVDHNKILTRGGKSRLSTNFPSSLFPLIRGLTILDSSFALSVRVQFFSLMLRCVTGGSFATAGSEVLSFPMAAPDTGKQASCVIRH